MYSVFKKIPCRNKMYTHMHTHNFALLLFSQTPVSFSLFQTRLSSLLLLWKCSLYIHHWFPFYHFQKSTPSSHLTWPLSNIWHSWSFPLLFFFFFLIVSFPGHHILVFLWVWLFLLCLLCHLFLSISPFELWLPWDLIRSRLLYLHSFP